MLAELESRIVELKADVVAQVTGDVVGVAVGVYGVEVLAVKYANRSVGGMFRLEHQREQIGKIFHHASGKYLHVACAHKALCLAHDELDAAGHSADFIGVLDGVG